MPWPLSYSGDLLFRLGGAPETLPGPDRRAEGLAALDFELLFKVTGEIGFRSVESKGVEERWRLARGAPRTDNPWNAAHAAAAASDYAHYVEPDVLHAPQDEALEDEVVEPQNLVAEKPLVSAAPFDSHWPPRGAGPAWHLGDDFTGFSLAQGRATGRGIRIAHLDTGYRASSLHAQEPARRSGL